MEETLLASIEWSLSSHLFNNAQFLAERLHCEARASEREEVAAITLARVFLYQRHYWKVVSLLRGALGCHPSRRDLGLFPLLLALSFVLSFSLAVLIFVR